MIRYKFEYSDQDFKEIREILDWIMDLEFYDLGDDFYDDYSDNQDIKEYWEELKAKYNLPEDLKENYMDSIKDCILWTLENEYISRAVKYLKEELIKRFDYEDENVKIYIDKFKEAYADSFIFDVIVEVGDLEQLDYEEEDTEYLIKDYIDLDDLMRYFDYYREELYIEHTDLILDYFKDYKEEDFFEEVKSLKKYYVDEVEERKKEALQKIKEEYDKYKNIKIER